MGPRCPQIKIVTTSPDVAQKEDEAKNSPKAQSLSRPVTRLFPRKIVSTSLPVLIDVFHRLSRPDLCMH